jgi:hypothetical protein
MRATWQMSKRLSSTAVWAVGSGRQPRPVVAGMRPGAPVQGALSPESNRAIRAGVLLLQLGVRRDVAQDTRQADRERLQHGVGHPLLARWEHKMSAICRYSATGMRGGSSRIRPGCRCASAGDPAPRNRPAGRRSGQAQAQHRRIRPRFEQLRKGRREQINAFARHEAAVNKKMRSLSPKPRCARSAARRSAGRG